MTSRPWHTLRHFTREEFGSGDSPERVAWDLVRIMDDVREAAGVPIVIHEAWAESGHAPKSYHYTGLAVDFRFIGVLPLEQFAILSGFRRIGGLGWYPTWATPGWHVDLRLGDERLCWVRNQKGTFYGCQDVVRALTIFEEGMV